MREQGNRLPDKSCSSEAGTGGGPPEGQRPVRFGQFLVFPGTRSLEKRGQPIKLGSRAFDLLMVLLRSRGKVVSKEEITGYVWPSTIVEDANLRVQVACLRRVLGSDRNMIKTVPRRGYLAIAEPEVSAAESAISLPAPTKRVHRTSPRGGGPSIVIIDGDPRSCEALHRLLQPFHSDVRMFASVDAYVGSGLAAAENPARQ